MKDKRQLIGKWGEQKAKEFLLKKGYTLIAENWRFRYGELDLIMLDQDQETVVFVEVRTKTGSSYGAGYDSLNHRKIQKLRITAKAFLHSNKWWNRSVRFDLISIDQENEGFKLRHLKNII